MNNSRDRVYADWNVSDRNRSIEKRESGPPGQTEWRNRYAYSPSPVAARKEGMQGRDDLRESQNLSYMRASVDVGEKTRNIERLAQQVALLEEKNKELFETYSQNDRKATDLLKSSKEENQSLLNNLKKLLAKPIINSETLANNPVREKLIAKIKEMNPLGSSLNLVSQAAHYSDSNDSGRSLTMENSFIVQELNKTADCRQWISALHHAKTQPATTTTK
jgi:hypothetical protein